MCTCPESTHNVTSSPEANGALGISSSSTTRIRLSPTMIVATIVPAIVFKYRTWPVRGYLAEVIMALFSFRTDSAAPAPRSSSYRHFGWSDCHTPMVFLGQGRRKPLHQGPTAPHPGPQSSCRQTYSPILP